MAATRTRGDVECVLDAMRSGEWLRSQWIARVAFELGADPWEPAQGGRVLAVLCRLEAAGRVERREVKQGRSGEIAGVGVRFTIPRSEWRLSVGGER